MVSVTPQNDQSFSGARATGLLLALGASALLLTSPAGAQQQAPAQKAPAASGGASTTAQNSAWVKLCEEQGEKKIKVCLTHHERFHPTTGQPLVSAAIRKTEGQDKEIMMFMVPLGRLLGPGLLVQVDKEKPVQLQYSYCTALGCVAEAEASDEIIGKLKKGSQLAVGTIDINRKRVGFRVPLTGFTRAYDGAPIDRNVYAQARRQMFEVIRKRQAELVKKAKEAAEKKKAAEGTGQPPKQTQ